MKPECLRTGRKRIRHKLVFNEEVDAADRALLLEFYVQCLVFKGESQRIQPKGNYSIEPRYALGQTKLIAPLARIARRKIERYGIRQIAAPGFGGVCALMCFLGAGVPLHWGVLRTDAEHTKKKRMLTAIDGYLDRSLPVWLTDDYLASGAGALSAIRLLRREGFELGGFIPVVADITANVGYRGFCCAMQSLPLTFDYLVGIDHARNETRTLPYDAHNGALYGCRP